MTALVEIPFKSTTITAMSDEGKPLVSIRHICESLGIDRKAQQDKLKSKTWARGVMIPLRDSAGRVQEMHMIDRRTMTMWLATIDTNRIKEESRPLLEAFQNEAADALDAYFHEGGAINPNATSSQLDRLAMTVKAQGEALQALSPFLSPKFLESKAKILVARALGEEPEIDPLDLPLHADDYLAGKGLKAGEIKSERSMFGRRIAKAYQELYREAPKKATNEVNGSIRMINAYTNRDRPLFDQVWAEHYAELFEPSLMDELA